MKEIKAVIQTAVLDKVLRALYGINGLPGCTVSYVHGYRRSGSGHADSMLEHEERAKLEIVVNDSDSKKAVDAILENARTGSPGDGKIFVIECPDVVSIRTGESGSSAV